MARTAGFNPRRSWLRKWPAGRKTHSTFNRLPLVEKGTGAVLFDELFLETQDKRNHVALFGLGHLKLCLGRSGMTGERVPITFTDAHVFVDEHHIPAAIVHWPARACAEEVNEKLLLALDAVFPAMRSKAAGLRIGLEPGQQIICHRRDRVIPAKALVKRFRLVAHRVLLKSLGRRLPRASNGKRSRAAAA